MDKTKADQLLRAISWSRGKTERERQEQNARVLTWYVNRWHFICDDGVPFSAIAISAEGAQRVLRAERPGHDVASMQGCTPAWATYYSETTREAVRCVYELGEYAPRQGRVWASNEVRK